jgi:hypothetical protein
MKKIVIGIGILFGAAGWILGQTGDIVSPKAGDVWTTGNVETVKWNFSGSGSVRLFLMDAGGAKVGNIKTGLTLAAGAYPWTVGQLESGGAVPPAKGYRIQMKLEGAGTLLDTGAGPFEIVMAAVILPAPLPTPPPPPPSNNPVLAKRQLQDRIHADSLVPILRVTQPVDGYSVKAGENCHIEWSLPGDYPMVKIMLVSLSQAGLGRAAQGSEIKASTENDGGFEWQVSDLERTGKFVVRVLTPDYKLYGDSGVVTINSKYLPPDQLVRVRARDVDTLLAQSATISIDKIDFSMIQQGKIQGIGVYVAVNSTSDFALSPDVGHPQYGSLYLRCVIENPYTDEQGNFSTHVVMDSIASLKGGGGSLKLHALPTEIAKGPATFTSDFHPEYPGGAVGQEVVVPMPGDWFSGGKKCFQQYFPKIQVTLHLVTKSGEALASKKIYMIYNTKTWPLSSVFWPVEVNSCQEGIQEW